MNTKKFYIITGGTTVPVAPHFSLSAPAYGTVGTQLLNLLDAELPDSAQVILLQTRMAQGSGPMGYEQQAIHKKAGLDRLETNEDLSRLLDYLISQEDTRCIVLATAVCDFEPTLLYSNSDDVRIAFGKDQPRLDSRGGEIKLTLRASEKLVGKVRQERKDIFLVAFKTMTGVSEQELYKAGLSLLKKSSANLVFANDIHAKRNLVITPEEFPYTSRTREEALALLVEMICSRSQLTFVRTKVLDSSPVDVLMEHENNAIPSNFVPVLKHLIENNAYKPFLGKTSGHFGCKMLEYSHFTRISSIRKVDHNKVFEVGMAKIYGIENDGRIIAAGGKPSVGEHTQHNIYETLGDKVHSIVHFHCPPKINAKTPHAPQKAFECGSVECGMNTSNHIEKVSEGIYAVHLDNHGPNIAFHKDVPAEQVIKYIDENWDLSDKTGGLLENGETSFTEGCLNSKTLQPKSLKNQTKCPRCGWTLNPYAGQCGCLK